MESEEERVWMRPPSQQQLLLQQQRAMAVAVILLLFPLLLLTLILGLGSSGELVLPSRLPMQGAVVERHVVRVSHGFLRMVVEMQTRRRAPPQRHQSQSVAVVEGKTRSPSRREKRRGRPITLSAPLIHDWARGWKHILFGVNIFVSSEASRNGITPLDRFLNLTSAIWEQGRIRLVYTIQQLGPGETMETIKINPWSLENEFNIFVTRESGPIEIHPKAHFLVWREKERDYDIRRVSLEMAKAFGLVPLAAECRGNLLCELDGIMLTQEQALTVRTRVSLFDFKMNPGANFMIGPGTQLVHTDLTTARPLIGIFVPLSHPGFSTNISQSSKQSVIFKRVRFSLDDRKLKHPAAPFGEENVIHSIDLALCEFKSRQSRRITGEFRPVAVMPSSSFFGIKNDTTLVSKLVVTSSSYRIQSGRRSNRHYEFNVVPPMEIGLLSGHFRQYIGFCLGPASQDLPLYIQNSSFHYFSSLVPRKTVLEGQLKPVRGTPMMSFDVDLVRTKN